MSKLEDKLTTLLPSFISTIDSVFRKNFTTYSIYVPNKVRLIARSLLWSIGWVRCRMLGDQLSCPPKFSLCQNDKTTGLLSSSADDVCIVFGPLRLSALMSCNKNNKDVNSRKRNFDYHWNISKTNKSNIVQSARQGWLLVMETIVNWTQRTKLLDMAPFTKACMYKVCTHSLIGSIWIN